jgi:tetratricopeptide (TPR) repeat protein
MPADPQRIRELFVHAVGKVPPGQWDAFAAEACGDDLELRKKLEQLLQIHREAGSFLESPAGRLLGTIDEPVAERPGTVIGHYKLIEEIGEGGMGTVWMAQQIEPVKRTVAVKLIKPGMDSKQVLARFEAERQALALMDHPNIAKVLDAGTIDSEHTALASADPNHLLALRAQGVGRPYFVMELVKGVPITKYCDEHRLTPMQRLELFVPVCQAVQHAHQKGIIHRDIKPSNILVALYDGKPVPKVIDFGVAKATGQQLTDKTLMTGFGSVVGTLEYMSPEQAELNQLDIDTRSDIYSLGVVLYELLTGSTPLDKKRLKQAAFAEVLRIIREEDPQKPSTRLSHSTDSLPSVSAQRQMEPAKLTKLVRGELDWIVMKALDKDRSRRYETANGFAMDIQRYLADEPVLACPPSAGYRIKKFARRNRGRLAVASVLAIALLATVGAAAGSIGWVARDRSARQARLTGQAEVILDEANRLKREQKWDEAAAAAERAEAVLAGGEASETLRLRIREVQVDRAFVVELDRLRQDRASEVEAKDDQSASSNSFAAARAMREYARAFREYGVDVQVLPAAEVVARMQRKPALVLSVVAALDDWIQARPAPDVFDPAWKSLVAVARALDSDPLRDRLRASWGQPISPKLQADLGQLADSIDVKVQSPATLIALARTLNQAHLSDAALAILRQSQDAHPADFWLNVELTSQLFESKNYAEAHAYISTALALRPDSALARNNLGVVRGKLGNLEDAIACLQKAIELDPKSVIAYTNLGSALRQQKKLDESLACYRKALELDPLHPGAHNNLGTTLLEQKKPDEALVCFRKALELAPRSALVQTNVGAALDDLKKPDEAIDCYRKAIQLDPSYAPAHYNLGNELRRQKKFDEAVACYRKAIQLDPKFVLAHHNLGLTLRDQKKLDEAVACYRKAIQLDPNLAMAYDGLGAALLALNKPDAAIACYQKVCQLNPQDSRGYFSLGIAFRTVRRLDESVASFRKAIAINPNEVRNYIGFGDTLLHQKKDLDEAIGCFRKAIKLDSKCAAAYYGLGRASFLQKNTDEAIAFFRKAIELDPNFALAHLNLGVALQIGKNKPDEAITCYRKAVDVDPDLAEGYLALGTALEHVQNKRDEAMVCYRKVIGLNPKNAKAHVSLGSALYHQKKLDEAIACLRKAIELEPNRYVQAYVNLGLALRDQKKVAEAIPCFEKAIELAPKNEDANFGLGVAYLDQNKLEPAIPCFEKTIELNPKNMNAHNNLGWALLSQGKLDQAIPVLQKALELSPRYAQAYENLGLAFLRQKKHDEAVACFRLAIEHSPGKASFHHDLGVTLEAQKHLDDAIAENQEAFRLDPNYARARNWLLDTLAPLGRLEEVRAAWENALAGNLPEHEAWFGYAELCLYLNNEDAYRRNRTALLGRFANTTDPAIAERTARASLLLPATGEELQTAVALADRAVALGKNSGDFRYYAIAKALAEYRLGHFESAIDWGQKDGAQGTCPTLLVLAMAHQRLGNTEQARQFLDEAVRTYEWKKVNREWGGISHALRREAEALLKVKSGVKEPATVKKPS